MIGGPHFRVSPFREVLARRHNQEYKEKGTMAEISLYLTNVNVSLAQNMDLDKVGSPGYLL